MHTSITFYLEVSNFLNAKSSPVLKTVARSDQETPAIRINAPTLITLAADRTVDIPASATVAPCFSSTDGQVGTVEFRWNISRATVDPGYDGPQLATAAPVLDSRTRNKRVLSVNGRELTFGLRYTLQVTGCMATAPTLCGYAEMNVTLSDTPLRAVIIGGDRTVSVDSSLALDACRSGDIDDPQAQCHGEHSCGTLRFLWTCSLCQHGAERDDSLCSEPCGSTPTPPSSIACVWTIASGVLKARNYSFSVVVTKITSNETAAAHRLVEGFAGSAPSVIIVKAEPSSLDLDFTQNPTRKLPIKASASCPSELDNTTGPEPAYVWSAVSRSAENAPNLTMDSTTGALQSTLVMKANTLSPNGMYTFGVVASCKGLRSTATAYLTITMSGVPWGGSLQVSSGPYTAGEPITLIASGWSDESQGGTMRYSFSYRRRTVTSAATSVATLLTLTSVANSAMVVMPEGDWTMCVTVTNSFDVSANATVNITVDASQASPSLVEIEQQLGVDDVDKASRAQRLRSNS